MGRKKGAKNTGYKLRHDSKMKVRLYRTYIDDGLAVAYKIYGEKFRDEEHFENYLIEKCKTHYEYDLQNRVKTEKKMIEGSYMCEREMLDVYNNIKENKYVVTIADCKGKTLEEIQELVDTIPTELHSQTYKPKLLWKSNTNS